MRRHFLCISAYLLALTMAFIAVRIEWLNARAGGVLPNREYFDSNPNDGVVEWRYSPFTTEDFWRRNQARTNAESRLRLLNGPLTDTEQRQMYSDVKEARARNDLLDFLESAGLLQYLLVPLVLGISFIVMRVKRRRLAIPPLICAVAAGVLMLYRGYFTSLGW
jgi:hypothetical protein